MSKIVTPKNSAGVITYPQTLTTAVYDTSGNQLETTLQTKGNMQSYIIKNSTISTSAWVTNTCSQASTQEKTDYPYMATISITSPAITYNDIARVVFNYENQTSNNFSSNCFTVENGVIIEAKEKPTSNITLEYILIERVL